MTRKAIALLERVKQTDDASAPLAAKDVKAAQELISAGLMVFIRSSRGRGTIALTHKGIAWRTS